MAHETQSESYVFSGRAASAIQPYGVVGFPAGSGIDYGLVPVVSASSPGLGVSRASHAVGDAAECIIFGEAKVRALVAPWGRRRQVRSVFCRSLQRRHRPWSTRSASQSRTRS